MIHGVGRGAWALTTLAILLGFAALSAVGALAVVTDQDSLASNSFTTGRIELSVGPTTTLVSLSQMQPGDAVVASVVVTNATGSAALRYAVTVSATDPDSKLLRDQIRLEIRMPDTGSSSSCSALTGAILYAGPLSGRPAGQLLGDTTQGGQAGDRPLSASASETLCFRFELPLSSPNAYNSASTTATFTFAGEQTTNNP